MKNHVGIPENAVQVRPNVYLVGESMVDGRLAQAYMFVHKRDSFSKPSTECGNGVCEKGENERKCPSDCGGGTSEPDTSSCNAFLGRGVMWKTTEPYMVDAANTQGLDEGLVKSIVASGIAKWESAAQKDILGDEIAEVVDGADDVSPDGKNEVMFGSIEGSDAIGVTIVWGYFSGPPKSRQILEWDQVYDEADFNWGVDGSPLVMDFENIATHELGHSVGMGDIYDASCSEVTMYGYASEGETKKRSLEAGDVEGVKKLYK